jgi:hypothetical protein
LPEIGQEKNEEELHLFDPFVEYWVDDAGNVRRLYWQDVPPRNKRVLRSPICHPRISTMGDDEYKRFMLGDLILSSMAKEENFNRIKTNADEFSLSSLIYESKITSKVFCRKMIRKSSIPYRILSKATIIPKMYEQLLREKLGEIRKAESEVRILSTARAAFGGEQHIEELIVLKRHLKLLKLGLSEL